VGEQVFQCVSLGPCARKKSSPWYVSLGPCLHQCPRQRLCLSPCLFPSLDLCPGLCRCPCIRRCLCSCFFL
jgi:hypothetical protein